MSESLYAEEQPARSEDALKARAALHRSMPVTRMLDYGMDHWDAVHLTAAPAEAPWHEVAAGIADAHQARADAAARDGDVETAVAAYRRASAALNFAQMSLPDGELRRTLYAGLTSLYQSAADLDSDLRVQRMQVPFRGSSCTAWLVRPRTDLPHPVVVIVGGQSGWGPAYHLQAQAFARRGLATVLLEAPGQGETRMSGGLHLDGGVQGVFSATVDVMQDLTGYDGPFGVWGNSFGGLLAARAAVFDERFGACCVNGAAPAPVPLPFRAMREQSYALLGVSSDEEVGEIFRQLWLEPPTHRMSASLLVVHGGKDPLVTQEQQEGFLGLSEDARMLIWEDGEHTIYNHSAERTDVVCDWFRAHLTPH